MTTLYILNRYSSPMQPYPLAEELTKTGLDIKYLDLKQIAICPTTGEIIHNDKPLPPKQTILNRITENLHQVTHPLTQQLTQDGHTLINTHQARTLAADKLATHYKLTNAGIPSIETLPVLQGNRIPENWIAKPNYGAGGRDIILNLNNQDTIPESSTEAWITQPYIKNHHDWIRILTVGETIIATYKRKPANLQTPTNNIETGSTREFITPNQKLISLAIQAAQTVGTSYAGIDIAYTPEDKHEYQIVEVNSSPGIPPTHIAAFAQTLKHYLT